VDKLLSLEAAAKILDKGERTIRNLCLKHARGEQGGIRSAKVGGTWRIRPDDMEDYIKGCYPAVKTKRQRG
jgi:hypothetical protein